MPPCNAAKDFFRKRRRRGSNYKSILRGSRRISAGLILIPKLVPESIGLTWLDLIKSVLQIYWANFVRYYPLRQNSRSSTPPLGTSDQGLPKRVIRLITLHSKLETRIIYESRWIQA